MSSRGGRLPRSVLSWLCALSACTRLAPADETPDPPAACAPGPAATVSRWTSGDLALHQVRLSGKSEGRRIAEHRVDAVDEPAFAVLASAVETFQSADEALRMIVPATRLERLRRRDDHVAITLVRPVPLRVLSGEQPLCVQELVIPLSGEWTRQGWTFYYREARSDWGGLRVSHPAPAAIEGLRRLLAAVASGRSSGGEREPPPR